MRRVRNAILVVVALTAAAQSMPPAQADDCPNLERHCLAIWLPPEVFEASECAEEVLFPYDPTQDECNLEGTDGTTDYYSLEREADGSYCKAFRYMIPEPWPIGYDPVPYYGQVVDGQPFCPSKDDGRNAPCTGLVGRGGSGQAGWPDCSFEWYWYLP